MGKTLMIAIAVGGGGPDGRLLTDALLGKDLGTHGNKFYAVPGRAPRIFAVTN